MRQLTISRTTATAGFVFLALMLAGDGFLLSRSPDDQSARMQAQSQPRAWQAVMKGLSHQAYNSDRQ